MKISMCELEIESLVTGDSITVYFEKPEELPKKYKYVVLLNGKETQESDKTHFLLEGLGSGRYYDVQVKVMGESEVLAESSVLHLHTRPAGNRLDDKSALYGGW